MAISINRTPLRGLGRRAEQASYKKPITALQLKTNKTKTPNKNMNTKLTLPLRLALCSAAALLTHTAHAQSWQTVDDLQYVAGKESFAAAVTFDPVGNLFVAGYGVAASGVPLALVEKSGDGGGHMAHK